MNKLNCVNLELILEEFEQLEQKITKINGKNSMLEMMSEDAKRLNKFYETKEKSLIDDKNSLRLTVKQLQQTLQEQCDLRAENERLKNDVTALREEKERTAEASAAEVQQLLAEMRAEEDGHRRELEAVRQQSSREVEDVHREALRQLAAKEAEMMKQLEEKDVELEVMKRRM
ncbi:coiled-coil domain-containing protein 152, partial [Austrofundulus limnaeus]|uniref:Coiled-coil domain-containing protein 152 n=1 Tax=Austrofundulus limnaeus TaxID=52670 RepID=A0A2I4AL31_AUSLI